MASTTSTNLQTSHEDRTIVDPVDRVAGTATIVGPLLMLGSTVAWLVDAEATRSILLMWGVIGFGLTTVGFAFRLRDASPVGAGVVLALGVISACAGGGYAAEAAIVEHFGIERMNDQSTLMTALVLQLPGLTFPLSLLAAALASWRARLLAPAHAGLLTLGAILFPASRLPELPGLAVVGDSLLLLALVPIGLAVLRGTPVPGAPAAPPAATNPA
jgi:hypothetical protein